MKTLIAVPCLDMVPADFMESLVNLKKPEDTSWTIVKNTLIHDARNLVAGSAIQAGFDRVMWFDSDMTFAPDTLLKLSQDMDETGADMVSGLYYTRRPPNIKPVAYKRMWWRKNRSGKIDTGAETYFDYPEGLCDIEAAGFGCMLTTTEIMNRVGEEFGSPFDMLPNMGEDMAFCWRAQKVGAKMLLDPRVKCGHIGQMKFDESWWKHGSNS